MSAYIGKVLQIASNSYNGIYSTPSWMSLAVEYSLPQIDVSSIDLGISNAATNYNDLFSLLNTSLTNGASVILFTRKGQIKKFEIEEIIIWVILISPLLNEREKKERFITLVERFGSKFNL